MPQDPAAPSGLRPLTRWLIIATIGAAVTAGAFWLLPPRASPGPVALAPVESPFDEVPPAPPPAPPAPGRPDAAVSTQGFSRRKALFVNQFARLADWPPTALSARHKEFELCIAGTGETADAVAEYAKATDTWHGRPARVRRLGDTDDLVSCHALFIAQDAVPSLERILSVTEDFPILTVSDEPGVAERGVLISLFRQGRYVHYQLNPAAAKRSRITFDPQVLAHASLIAP
jgi:hypothetical protein